MSSAASSNRFTAQRREVLSEIHEFDYRGRQATYDQVSRPKEIYEDVAQGLDRRNQCPEVEFNGLGESWLTCTCLRPKMALDLLERM